MSKSFRDKAEAKRTSANNPAMMFITPPEEEEAPEVTVNPETGRKTLHLTESPAHKRIREQQEQAEAEGRKREASPLQAEAPMRAPQGREAKTRRLQLLLTPSLYEAVKERADAEGLSVNETIGELLMSALSKM